jgi:hypothetical protein
MAGTQTTKRDLVIQNRALVETATMFEERIAELEFALEDQGWRTLGSNIDRDFSRAALRLIARLCRINYLKNPLINHAVEVQRHYVFGRPVSITAKDETINEVVQGFLDDPKNKAEFTDPRTMAMKEVDLLVNGNLFFPLFTNDSTGSVRMRSISFDEVTDIITDPEDAKTPQYYKREWTEHALNLVSGELDVKKQVAYYPDWRHDPAEGATRPQKIGAVEVKWESPVMHVKTGGLSDMVWGVPEIYPAIDWARAVKQDMEDYATIKRALARYALSLTVKGGAQARAAAKTKLATTFAVAGTGEPERNPPAVAGSTFIQTEGGAKIEAMNKTGATVPPDEGRRLWLMVGAGVGLPETILSGDAEVGNLATAKTLDRPTELKMTERQTFWKGVIGDILDYVVAESVEAPSGLLHGMAKIDADPLTQEPTVIWNDENTDDDIDIQFPDVIEHDPETKIQALVNAATLMGKAPANTIPDMAVSKMLMQLLGFDDVDALLDQLYPDGEDTPATGNLGTPVLLGPDGMPLKPGAPGGGFTPGAIGGDAFGNPNPLNAAWIADQVLVKLGHLIVEARERDRKNGHVPTHA